MHNNIMTAGSRDPPPMLATKCILEGPYTPSTVTILAVPATDDSLEVPERTTVEIILNMSPENKTHYESEKEEIHLLLTGIKDEIYSTVDACKTAHDMWIAIERLQQGKEIANPITPPSESASKEDSDPEQDQRDKDMQKNLALIAKYFKKIYKPTNNNLKASLNSRNKNVDNSPWETVGSQETKREKDYTYYKEKMLLCKQAEKGVLLEAEQADWLEDMDEEINEQELEAHHNYMAKIQEVPTTDSGTNTEPLEKVQYDAEYNVFANIDQNVEQCDDERVALANLIANLIENLTLDTEENKKILKQLKKANTSLTQELKECKSNLEQSNTTRDSCLMALQSKQSELETYIALNDRTVDYDKLKCMRDLASHGYEVHNKIKGNNKKHIVSEKPAYPRKLLIPLILVGGGSL
ncbi:hypothetical protein Tco_0154907 [Tanacetum coccineum]